MLTPVNQPVQSAVQQVQDSLERASAAAHLNAFITLYGDAATEAAADVDARAAAGPHLPLAGVPLAVKDNLCVAGELTTAASRMLREFRPPHTATVVSRLQAAGATVMGKANLDEFAMGSSNESSAFGPVRNPHNPERVPGGSSGGSAAAVAAGIVPIALGTDTGGSVRQPASLCGIVGLKPTYGRLSRWGALTLAMSMDQVGVLARTTSDVARTLAAISGVAERDSTTVALARMPAPELPESLQGLRIGMIDELCGDSNTPGVQAALKETVGLLESFGASVG